MSLFEENEELAFAPLATRMRPREIAEFVGQEHLFAEGSPIRTAIEAGKLGSAILWGPAGSGKTTLAHLIAIHSNAYFEARSAVTVGVAEIRKIAQLARQKQSSGRRTLLFLDEIHGFNRSQQDTLLPYVEDGTLTLVGATTENPFFVIATPLLSRARVLILKALEPKDIELLVRRALADEERGLGSLALSISDEALQHLLRSANGDARVALNALEASAQLAGQGGEIDLETTEAVLQRQAVRYDRQGDYHYDTISAFIKSMRGSDPDAALHYLARMIAAGEDPRFICRRIMILASEDIGNADPMAMVVALSASQAVERIGYPEAQLILSQVVTYMATAPKSNAATTAIGKAMSDVQNKPLPPVPIHLRDAHHPGVKKLGHGKDYKYPHSFPGAWVDQQYAPEDFIKEPYYEPSDRGHEKKIKERMEKIKEAKKSKE
jgi:putative ATPase